MASPSTVISRGYGSFGSVNLLPTRGYGIASPSVPPLFTLTGSFDYLIVDEFNIGDYGTTVMEVEDERVYFVGDIKRFEVHDITKDGVPWALTGVTLYLVQPNANGTTTLLTRAATQIDSTTWAYDTVAGDLSVTGVWRRYWQVTDGQSPNKYGAAYFTVRDVL